MQDLQGQWALVTGASSGFGVDFAHLLAQRGANVVLAARSVEPMEALAVELEAGYGVRAHVVGVDLARPGAGLARLAERADGVVDSLHAAHGAAACRTRLDEEPGVTWPVLP
jgi:short-subunit dehydrogenase